MRDFIDIVEGKSKLTESVEFEPRVRRTEVRDGKEEVIIDYPPNTTRRELVDCEYCEDGKDKYDGYPCMACDGVGKDHKWFYDFPKMRVGYMQIEVLTDMLGRDFDHSGYIPPEQLPELKRRLMLILNRDADKFTTPDEDEQGPTRIDRSGDIPRITRGPRMIGFGLNSDAIRAGAQKMLEIVDWAQKNGTGVGWA